MDEERLIVALEARIRDFERNMEKAERQGTRNFQTLQRRSKSATAAMERDMTRSTSRINQALASTSSRIGSFGKAFVAGAVVAGLGAITRGSVQAIRSMAELDAQARRTGVSVEAFQELKFVAEQQRIGVDQLTDGLKELQLRADEFVETGKGPASDAFARLGYDARDLSRRLEEPEELFLDLIRRMEDLDRAAQIRVADEVFGGTGGERFVELMRQGEGGIRDMMDRAHELGVVMDEEAIAKAAELDRKFAEVGQRVSTLAKNIVVDLAGAIDSVLSIDLDDLFGSAERAARMLGDETYRAMGGGAEMTADQRREVEDLVGSYDDLFRRLDNLNGAQVSLQYSRIDSLRELADVLIVMDAEMKAFRKGETDAAAFEAQIGTLIGEAESLVGGLNDVDAAKFENLIAAIGGISMALRTATADAQTLKLSIPGPGASGGDRAQSPPAPRPRDEAPVRSRRPRPVPNNIDAGYNPPSAPSLPSVGGGGAAPRISEYQREVEGTREAIAKLEAEAVELDAAVQGGREFGAALEYARKRAELLYQAQASGKTMTPELKAEIDELAASYTEAGRQAETAADRLRLIEENAERGADRMTDLFGSILDGSASATDAIKGLLAEIAKTQMRTGLAGLIGGAGGNGEAGSGFLGWLGGALSGGRATGGPVRGGDAYMVNERTPRSEVFVPSQSGGVLNVPQAQAALRGQVGGGGSGSIAQRVKVEVVGGNLSITDGGELMQRVRVTARQASSSAVQQYDEQVLPDRFGADGRMSDPRRRG